jgi:hypothetical protein
VPWVEDCLPFWVDRLGFEKTVEVPDDDRLGFVIIERGAVEVMLQSQRSFALRSALGGYPDMRRTRRAHEHTSRGTVVSRVNTD